KNAGPGTLGNYALCIVGQDISGAPYASVLANNYKVGDELILTNHFITDGVNWPEVEDATSGNCMTMVAGKVVGNKGGLVDQTSYNGSVYARTIYGTNDDGTKLYIGVCGHKSGEYYGLSTDQLTYVLKHFGATYAAQVDCGGSAQMFADGSQVNHSTDASGTRAVHSGLFVVSSAKVELQPVELTITPAGNADFGTMNAGSSASKTYSITGKNLRDNITMTISGADAAQFTINNTSILKANGKGDVTVTYTPSRAGTHTASLVISTPDYPAQTITLTGTAEQKAGADVIYQDDPAAYGYEAPSSYTVQAEYTDKAVAELAGKVIKRVIPRGDVLYILAHKGSEATIVVYDHVAGRVLRTLGTTANTVGKCGVADIAITGDGWLVGMNWADQTLSAAGQLIQYVWAKDSNGIAQGDPMPANLTNQEGNWSVGTAGGTMAWAGTRTSGWWYYPGRSSSGSTFRMMALEIKEMQLKGNLYYNLTTNLTTGAFGDAFGAADGGMTLFTSPYADNEYIVNGTNSPAILMKRVDAVRGDSGGKATATVSVNVIPSNAVHTGIFRMGGKIYMTSPSYRDNTVNCGVILADITDGLDKAKAVSLSGASLSDYANTNVATTGMGVAVLDETGKYVESRLALFAVRNGAVSKFMTPTTIVAPGVDAPELTTNLSDVNFGEMEVGTTAARSFNIEGENLQGDILLSLTGSSDFRITTNTISAEEGAGSVTVMYSPTTRGTVSATLTVATKGMRSIDYTFTGTGVSDFQPAAFAYGLKVEQKETMYNYTFSLSQKSHNVTLVLHSDSGKDYSYPQGTMAAGTHTLSVPFSLLEPAHYTWEVLVDNKGELTGGRFFFDGADATSRGGVVAIKDTESEAFGLVVRSDGYAKGFTIYEPTTEKRGTYLTGHSDWTASNRASIYRVAYRKSDGCVYANDYADKGAGVYVFNPLHPEYGTGNIFAPAGATKDSGGCWTYNGVALGGGNSGFCFIGEGDDTQMWSFQEDYPSGNAKPYCVVSHKIGKNTHVTTAPTVIGDSKFNSNSMWANTNVSFYPCSHGVFVAQHRGAGNNNAGCPGFVLVDFEGNILYNSGEHSDIIEATAGAVALNREENLLAVGMGTLGIKLYDVAWNGNVPTLTFRAELPDSRSTKDGADEVCQMDFDYAGNLYAYYGRCTNTHDGLSMFIVPGEATTTATPAPKSQGFDATVVCAPATEVVALTHSAQINTVDTYYAVSGESVLSADLTAAAMAGEGKIPAIANAAELTITEHVGGTFTISSAKGYLAAGDGLTWTAAAADATLFSIAVDAAGNATVKAGDTNIGAGFVPGADGALRLYTAAPRKVAEVGAIADATEAGTLYVIKGDMAVLHAGQALDGDVMDVFFTDGTTIAAAHVPYSEFTAALDGTAVISNPIVVVSAADDKDMYAFESFAGTLRGFERTTGTHREEAAVARIHALGTASAMKFVRIEDVVVNSTMIDADGYTLSHAFDRATELTATVSHKNLGAMVETDGEKAPVYNVTGFHLGDKFILSSIEACEGGYAVPAVELTTSILESDEPTTADVTGMSRLTLFGFNVNAEVADHVVVFYTKDGTDPQDYLAAGVQPVADPALRSTVEYVDALDNEANEALEYPEVPYSPAYFTHKEDWLTMEQYSAGKLFYALGAGSEEGMFLAAPRSLVNEPDGMTIKAIAVVAPQEVEATKTAHFTNALTVEAAAFSAPQTWEAQHAAGMPAQVSRAAAAAVSTGHSDVLKVEVEFDTVGVEDVAADADTEAVYYDLGGINRGTDASVLAPGVYLRHTANGTTKVHIR
ncbi:MAG: choice-of-anchor D domain-containing protein, partial [Muribaculaceae bacterium]|nr:choice-of-anchor D domain-containing protein [Muribaculaceae bacterium]